MPAPDGPARPIGKRLDIQGVRALAVLLVVAFHAGLPLSGGFAGVDVFFVVSGFVIGRLLLREVETTGRVDLARFFASRAKRLLPALVVVIAATLVAAGLLTIGDRLDTTARSGFAAALMVSNFFFQANTGGYFDVPDGEVPLLHTWSLSVEGQFYLVVPLVLWALWWGAARAGLPRRRTLVVATVLATAGSFLAAQLLATGHTIHGIWDEPRSWAFYASPTRAWEFLIGVLVALGERRLLTLRRPRLAAGAGLVGLVAVLTSAFLAGRTGPIPAGGVLVPVLGTALLIAAGTTATPSRVSRLLGARFLVAIGDRSYAWYLWHWPFIVLGGLALPGSDVGVPLALASMVPAWLSYRYVESVVRRQRTWRGRHVAALGLASVAAVALLAVGVTSGQRELVQRAGIPNLDAALKTPTILEDGQCTGSERYWDATKSGVAHCSPGVARSAPRLLLVGDSHAEAYAVGVRSAARQHGFRMDIASGPSCYAAPLLTPSGRPQQGGKYCAGLPGKIASTIREDPPALLVVAQAELLPERAPIGQAGPDARRRYARALTTMIDPVLAHGGKVLMLATVPSMRSDGSTCVTAWRLVTRRVRSCLSESEAWAVTRVRQMPFWQATLDVARADPSRIGVFDPAPLFCRGGRCSQIRAGILAYRNPTHVGRDGVRTFEPQLRLAVDRALGPAS